MLGMAILGCGRIGKMHADNLSRHPRVALRSVYDVHQPSADETAARYGSAAARDVGEILGDAGIDAVLIATSTDTHADLIEAAAAAGKAILCEKPIDLSLDRVNLCAKRLEGAGVPIQIGFNRRFDPGHRAARDAMLAGEIGDLHQVIITSRDPELPPKSPTSKCPAGCCAT